ncbi:MAG TPA: PmoA family protein [Blastocatellia bacterium]|nr:PmoA family protein [Blastocatellia bacterium]
MLRRQAAYRLALAPVAAIMILWTASAAQIKDSDGGVRVVANEAARRVDVLIDGQPFTSYVWPDTIKKPVLYPLRTAAGTIVTRGYPLDPRAGERVDHPHHVGLWFNYGDVNGIDFWNNSDAIKPEEKNKYGTIRHVKIKRAASGKSAGELEVEMDWLMPDGKAVLREETKFIFHAGPNLRAIDRITKLTALDGRVTFNDNKEGVLGLRVARQLEQPSDKAELFTDQSGKATAVPKLDNAGVTGRYRSSEGKQGDDVWGTRGKWAMLTGKIGQEQVTLAILDHPKNPGYPTYWHARGYGLFAANPLGQEVFTNGKQKLKFALEAGQSATFRYRVLIISGETSPDDLEARYQSFIGEVK